MRHEKLTKKLREKTAKNNLKLAKIDQRWPNFSQIQFLFDKIFEFLWKQSYILLGYLIEIQKLVLTYQFTVKKFFSWIFRFSRKMCPFLSFFAKNFKHEKCATLVKTNQESCVQWINNVVEDYISSLYIQVHSKNVLHICWPIYLLSIWSRSNNSH